MACCVLSGPAIVWAQSLLLWMFLSCSHCESQSQAEEAVLFSSDKLTKMGWKSEPPEEWRELPLPADTGSSAPVLQACGKIQMRTILSQWMERRDANHLLMDITVAQEEEPSGRPKPLKVHLFDTDTPLTKFLDGQSVLDLQSSKPFPSTVKQISGHLNRSLALNLGSVERRGFQLAFSYSGTCVFLTSIRLYYRRCPDIVSDLTSFGGTGAGSGPVSGSCAEGAFEISPPERECNVEGQWGSLEGGCACKPGFEETENTCKACRIGFYKPANKTAGCQRCPPNTWTQKEGSENCGCLQGFGRLPTDPHDFGCTKPPSPPVNLTAGLQNDSVLSVVWDPPLDRGGRKEVKYRVKCEKKAEAASQWQACGSGVVIEPDSDGLSNTSVIITGLKPQCDYMLSVQAWNDVSALQGVQHSSTATVIIHKRKTPPVIITAVPEVNISGHGATSAPLKNGRLSIWLTAGVLLGSLLLVAVITITLYVTRKNYTKLRSNQEIPLLPTNLGISYQRPQMVEAVSQQSNVSEGVIQLLDGLGGRFPASLKELLVERNQLVLGKELGKGEFGSVYEGVFSPEEGVNIKVAVKTMRVGIHCQEDLQEFLREAEIMKNFDHKNVISLLGVTLQREQDSRLPVPLVILPYMKHGDLRRFLIATRYGDIPMFVPDQTLLRFMIDIAAGMEYLSLQGFLHRDLAARNCMLGDDLRVCVADFGLSKKIYSSNYYRQKVAIRVPIKWMSIESLSESVYTTKSDVWSFGVTMWEIVSRGKTPYPGIHNHELLDLLLSGHRLKPPADCDQKLYEVMHSCWNSEPNLRPDFGNLLETLRCFLSELPVLEACQEASYINLGLDVAGAAAAASEDPQTDSGERQTNVYLPCPVAVAGNGSRQMDVQL